MLHNNKSKGGCSMDNMASEVVNFELGRRFIPGVFNYCDKWCQTCSLTTRCSYYMLLTEIWTTKNITPSQKPVTGTDGIVNTIFKYIQTIHNESIMPMPNVNTIDNNMHEHYQLGLIVADNINNWLKAISVSIDIVIAGLPNHRFIELRDDIEFIVHNLLLLPNRCVLLFTSDQVYTVINKQALAKTVIINCERSIMLIKKLSELFLDDNKLLAGVIVSVSKFISIIEQQYKEARLYKRPGFDK